jgi:ABC-type bacteriocin/lantibiotic exporter with double-glycine peptidase domain
MLFSKTIRVIFFTVSFLFVLVCYKNFQTIHPSYFMNNFMDLLQQPDDITCGPTSAVMLMRFYGINSSISDVKKKTRTVWYSYDGKDIGMTAPEMIRISLISYGLNAKLNTGNMRDLKNKVSLGKPCIVLVRSWEWGWHYVVVFGYGDGVIYFANPSDGEVDALSYNEFFRAWDWGGDLQGRKCSWWQAFWLRSIEIYPCSYVYID